MPLEGYQVTELLTTLMIGSFVVLLAYSPLPRSLGQALLHRLTRGRDGEATPDAHMDEISSEVAALRQALYETQERLDFAERMLATSRAQDALPGGS